MNKTSRAAGMIREKVGLAPYTYYKIGGPARCFAEPTGTHDLEQIGAFLRSNGMPYFILGAGSNVLFDDRGFDGLVLSTSKLDRTLEQDGVELNVGASTMVIQLLRRCMSEGLAGFEFLVGVPGSMGGVLYMNAGTKLGEISGCVLEVRAFDLSTGQVRTVPHDRIRYTYRTQHFLRPHDVIVGGRLRGKASSPAAVQKNVQELLAARKRSQPVDKPSCGSVFKNPDPEHGVHAWQLIDRAGLRGRRAGGAQISELHTNFIVNLGGAKAADVLALIDEAKAMVKERSGVELETEVKIVPFHGTSFVL